MKISLETKSRLLNYYAISVLLYGGECRTISLHMEIKLNITEMRFYRKIVRIPVTECIRNEKVLREIEAKRRLMLSTRKRQLILLGYIIRENGLENLTLTGIY